MASWLACPSHHQLWRPPPPLALASSQPLQPQPKSHPPHLNFRNLHSSFSALFKHTTSLITDQLASLAQGYTPPTTSDPHCPDVDPRRICDDSTPDSVASQTPLASKGPTIQDSRVPSWSVSVLALVGVFAAGWALGSRRILSRDAGFRVGMQETQVQSGAKEIPEQLFGHFRAEEAPQSDLKAVLADGSVLLRTAAAEAFLRMQEIAWRDGVWLIPLSGFRSIQCQKEVFYDVKAERGQQTVERAKVSAPPGYSEHHTGYALDIGDSSAAWTHLETEFEQTAAFTWLKINATRFHFEMSFPPNNGFGIMYEPWHWRFVGDDDSLRTFFSCKNQDIYNGCQTRKV